MITVEEFLDNREDVLGCHSDVTFLHSLIFCFRFVTLKNSKANIVPLIKDAKKTKLLFKNVRIIA